MKKSDFLNTRKLFTSKAIGLYDLFTSGYRIPYTIILQEGQSFAKIPSLVAATNYKYWYIRFNFSDIDYPHHISLVSEKEDILKNLSKLSNHVRTLGENKYDIIIQPMLNFSYSGAALIKENHTLIELVSGHPWSLFRLGEYSLRLLLNKDGDLLQKKEGQQKTFTSLHEGSIKMTPCSNNKVNISEIFETVSKIQTPKEKVIEFGIVESELIYLESKETNPLSYKDTHLQLPTGKPFIIHDDQDLKKTTVHIQAPTFREIKNIKEHQTYLIESGAYLSHFVTYCASKNINCTFLT